LRKSGCRPKLANEYATVCGETLARGHARSGDPYIIAGYIGTSERFDEAVSQFAAAYASQTESDWQNLIRSRSNTNPGIVLALAAKSQKNAGRKSKAETTTAKAQIVHKQSHRAFYELL
jgi:hypothetical protein